VLRPLDGSILRTMWPQQIGGIAVRSEVRTTDARKVVVRDLVPQVQADFRHDRESSSGCLRRAVAYRGNCLAQRGRSSSLPMPLPGQSVAEP
jgi:hypothetical protein